MHIHVDSSSEWNDDAQFATISISLDGAGLSSGLSLKLADPTNAIADLCLERAHTGSSVAAGITGVKISAKPDLDGIRW